MKVFLNPVEGDAIKIEKVKDPTFSKKTLGDGYAIEPTKGKIYSPVRGTIIVDSKDTKHAYGIKDDKGNEILIHIGLDTVELGGYGFTSHVSEGQIIDPGQLIAEVDLKKIKESKKSSTIIIVFTKLNKGTLPVKVTGKKLAKQNLLEN